MEVDLRRTNREIEEMTTRLAETRAGGRPSARGGSESESRNSIIDTSFAMDVGETVVVGTSRLKGGSKALIALLTAVPPRAPPITARLSLHLPSHGSHGLMDTDHTDQHVGLSRGPAQPQPAVSSVIVLSVA